MLHQWVSYAHVIIKRYDFIKDCGPFQMPYYIFQGRKDNNTPSSLVQAYYDSIVAPDKKTLSGSKTPPTARWARSRRCLKSSCGRSS